MSILWQQWRQAEGTLLVIKGLRERRDKYKELLATGEFTYKTCEATAMKTAEVIGRINEIDELLQLMLTDEADDGADSNSRQDYA
jgi:hypothetical protein